jgi:hypothetical protein
MITEDLYLGLMKKGDEKITDAAIAIAVIIASGILHLISRCNRLIELRSFLMGSWFNWSFMFSFLPKRGQI